MSEIEKTWPTIEETHDRYMQSIEGYQPSDRLVGDEGSDYPAALISLRKAIDEEGISDLSATYIFCYFTLSIMRESHESGTPIDSTMLSAYEPLVQRILAMNLHLQDVLAGIHPIIASEIKRAEGMHAAKLGRKLEAGRIAEKVINLASSDSHLKLDAIADEVERSKGRVSQILKAHGLARRPLNKK